MQKSRWENVMNGAKSRWKNVNCRLVILRINRKFSDFLAHVRKKELLRARKHYTSIAPTIYAQIHRDYSICAKICKKNAFFVSTDMFWQFDSVSLQRI